ncbi:hypothetical protein OG215_38820 (plasmid) [Streptomyces globisporus]|nr:hypothetical protein OG215_38820 [Streptomyces globisporus]
MPGCVDGGDVQTRRPGQGQRLIDFRYLQAGDGGHGAVDAVHETGPFDHELEAGEKGDDTGGFQGIVLAKAVAEQNVGRGIPFQSPPPERESVDDIDGGLGEAGVSEYTVGVVETETAKRVAEDVLGTVGQIGEQVEEVFAHSDMLCSLPGEE